MEVSQELLKTYELYLKTCGQLGSEPKTLKEWLSGK